jgi:hypothetical protein
VFDTDGATSLFTTVGDLLKWEQNFADAKVGGRALVDEAMVSGRLNDGTPVAYGWGLSIGTYRGVKAIGHGGADAGYRSDVVRFPDHDLAIAVFCNLSTTNPGELSRQVAEILLPPSALSPLPTEASVTAESLAPLAGVYWNPVTDDLFRAVVADGALRTSPTGPALPAVGDGRFRFSLRSSGELVFPPAARASDQELHILSPPLPPAVFKRLPPVPASVDLAPFAGSYHSRDLGATYEVVVQGSSLAIKRPRLTDLVVEPVGAAQFAGAFGGPTVTFQRSGPDVSGMTISMGRVRRLPFERVAAPTTDLRR